MTTASSVSASPVPAVSHLPTRVNLTADPTFTLSPFQSCVTVVPGKDGYVPSWACNSNYNYNPSRAAAIIFAVLFGITTFLHIYQAITYSKKKLCWVIIMGSLWEFASFAIRSASTKNQQSEQLAFWSQLLVLLAPMWVNAFDYMVLGRMIHFFIPEKKVWRIKSTQIAKIFVWLDILSFLTQLAGGVLIAPGGGESQKEIMMGIHIYMGGIGLQELCILCFTAIATRFLFIKKREQKEIERNRMITDRPTNWLPLLVVLYGSLALITMRIIYRLDEFAAGLDPTKNKLPYHEVYFYVLDALPMFIAIGLMNIIHPGSVLVGPESEFPKGPSRKEKKAIKAAKKAEKQAVKEEKKMAKMMMRKQQQQSDGGEIV
ncbi:hypothetical protein B7463_g1244, partial [Scytalidium lignicola]